MRAPGALVRPLVAVALVLCAGVARAETWVEAKSPNFTVVSNAGEKKARNVAWQFEQIRSAIEKGWPWARVRLNRPVVVIAVKDLTSMKALAPYYWEEHRDIHPSSVLVSASDRHYIGLRADLQAEDRDGINPYASSFWSYSSLTIDTAFGRGLPLWFRVGLAAVLSNSIVRETEIQFGRPIPGFVRQMQTGQRLRLPEFVALDGTSPYYNQQTTRGLFNAQSWGLVQYLLFGDADRAKARVDQLTELLLAGKPSQAALTEVYGPIDKLEAAYLNYLKAGFFRYTRLEVESDVSAQKYPTREMPVAEADAVRAGFHVAMARISDARALIAEGRKADDRVAGLYEVEGLTFDRESKREEAQRAYARAADLGSGNFYVYLRLANLTATPAGDAEAQAAVQKLLGKSIALNDVFAPSLFSLARALLQQNQAANALGLAERAAKLEPDQFSYPLLLARVLARLGRTEDARRLAQAAMDLTRTEQDRRAVQSLITSLNATPAKSAGSDAVVGGVESGVGGPVPASGSTGAAGPPGGVARGRGPAPVPTNLSITDKKGTVTVLTNPVINYAADAAGASALVRDGIRVYQGQGQVVVKWSLIDKVTFAGEAASAPDRLKGDIQLEGGRRLSAEFVVPTSRGVLTGKTDLGDFSIAFTDVATIATVKVRK